MSLALAFFAILPAVGASPFAGSDNGSQVSPSVGNRLNYHEATDITGAAQPVATIDVTSDEYRAKMLHYLRLVWEPEAAGKSDAELNALISDALALGQRIGDTRRGTLTDLVVIFLLAPELVSESRVQRVLENSDIAPNHRSSEFMAPLAVRYSIPDRLNFMAKIQAFADF